MTGKVSSSDSPISYGKTAQDEVSLHYKTPLLNGRNVQKSKNPGVEEVAQHVPFQISSTHSSSNSEYRARIIKGENIDDSTGFIVQLEKDVLKSKSVESERQSSALGLAGEETPNDQASMEIFEGVSLEDVLSQEELPIKQEETNSPIISDSPEQSTSDFFEGVSLDEILEKDENNAHLDKGGALNPEISASQTSTIKETSPKTTKPSKEVLITNVAVAVDLLSKIKEASTYFKIDTTGIPQKTDSIKEADIVKQGRNVYFSSENAAKAKKAIQEHHRLLGVKNPDELTLHVVDAKIWNDFRSAVAILIQSQQREVQSKIAEHTEEKCNPLTHLRQAATTVILPKLTKHEMKILLTFLQEALSEKARQAEASRQKAAKEKIERNDEVNLLHLKKDIRKERDRDEDLAEEVVKNEYVWDEHHVYIIQIDRKKLMQNDEVPVGAEPSMLP